MLVQKKYDVHVEIAANATDFSFLPKRITHLILQKLNVFIRQHPFHIIIRVFKRLSPIIYELYRRVTKALHARHPRYALHAHAPRVKQRGKANQTVCFLKRVFKGPLGKIK